MKKTEIKRFKQRLEERRAEIEVLIGTSAESREAVELDQTRQGRLSRMDALQGQAMAQATHERRQRELQKIEAALMRIEEDAFGYCVSCGEEVEAKRLDFDPAAPLCMDCAAN